MGVSYHGKNEAIAIPPPKRACAGMHHRNAASSLMKYKVFYSCHKHDKHISSDSPEDMELDDILENFHHLLIESPDFLGLIDSEGTVLQFAIEGDLVWMEIPIPKRQGSSGQNISKIGALQTLKELKDTFSTKDFPSMRFRPWGS